MEILVKGEKEITVDLVFVHGIKGHPIDTWRQEETVWPRDLLPADVKNARIMTFAYNSDISNFLASTSESSIFQHSLTLLQDLQRERCTPEEKQRPIIFIGHSMGGLVIKDALCKAFEFSNLGWQRRAAALFHATAGVIFLGTPHRGSNKIAWANVAQNLAKAVSHESDPRAVEALKRGSEVLERVHDTFCGLVHRLTVYSFFEELPVEGIGKIVDDDSATIGHPSETKQWLPADHIGMCKFSDSATRAYRRVSGAIMESIEDVLSRREISVMNTLPSTSSPVAHSLQAPAHLSPRPSRWQPAPHRPSLLDAPSASSTPTADASGASAPLEIPVTSKDNTALPTISDGAGEAHEPSRVSESASNALAPKAVIAAGGQWSLRAPAPKRFSSLLKQAFQRQRPRWQSPWPHHETLRRFTLLDGRYERCGDHAEAEEVARLKDRHDWQAAHDIEARILRQQRATHGDRHPATLQSVYSLAESLRGLGLFKRAQKAAEEVHSTAKDVLVEHDPFTLRADGLTAAILLDRGRERQAHERAKKVLELQTQVLGGDHLDTLDTRITLASCWGTNALERFGDCYLRGSKLLGAEHGLTISTMILWMGWCLDFDDVQCCVDRYPTDSDKQKMLKQAIEQPLRHEAFANAPSLPHRLNLIADAYRILLSRLGNTDPMVLSARTTYGRSLLAIGRVGQAEDELSGAVSDAKYAFGAEHPEVLPPCLNLATLYLQQRRAQEAIALLLKIRPAYKHFYGLNHFKSAFTYLMLGQAYIVKGEENGNLEKADRVAAVPYLQQALEMFYRRLGSESYWTITARLWFEKCGTD